MRELSIECRKKGIVLSIDNYQPSAWTEFYDRNQQGRLADYVVVMNYDEHTASSNEAGSVSSLTFTEEGLKNTIDEVGDASRVINGMPFYTRIWTETPEDESDGNGKLIEDAAMVIMFCQQRLFRWMQQKKRIQKQGLHLFIMKKQDKIMLFMKKEAAHI